MTWPIYFPPDEPLPDAQTAPPAWRPVLRHDQRQRAPTLTGAPKLYGAAVDVWRDGFYLWRSYTGGTTCDAWTDENMGAEAPRNHDAGLWGVPGVVDVADSPIPDKAALAPVYGLQGVADLLYTVAAIALGPLFRADPDLLTHPPTEQVLRQRLSRAERDYIVVAFEEQGVSVRAMIAPLEPQTADGESPAKARYWTTTLERRETRQGAINVTLTECTATFAVLPNAPTHIVARRAKAALGISGWQAARQGNSMVWHLARAPYRMTIEPLDSPTNSGAGLAMEDSR